MPRFQGVPVAQPAGGGRFGGVPVGAPPAEAQAEQPGFMERVGEAWGGRGEDLARMYERETQGGMVSDVMNAPRIGIKSLGPIAGGVADVVGEGVKTAYNAMVPEPVKDYMGERATATAQNIMAQPLARVAGDVWGATQKYYPELAEDIEGAANVAMVTPLAKGAKGLAGTLKATPEKLAKKQAAQIAEGIKKSIRPGVEGKRTFGQTEAYFKKAEGAVKSIVSNKQALNLTDEFGEAVKGKLPENLRQFSQAIDQSKQNVFKKYNEMAKAAGQTGAKVELKPIASELEKIVASRPLADNAPEVVRYAKQRAAKLANTGAYTAEEAQDAIKYLNSSLESFYKNPSYDSGSKAFIDSLVANKMRENLDSAITKMSGKGYGSLKKEYGALKAIERDVNRRAIVDGRKAGVGMLGGITDVFSGERAIAGILSMNPAIVGQAASMQMISKAIKMINDPNRVVKKMFKRAEKGANKMATTAAKPRNAMAKGR